MDEFMSKLAVERFAFLVIPSIHRARFGFMRGGSGTTRVRVGLKGSIQNDG